MIKRLLAFVKLGQNQDAPRLWLESQRLSPLGFSPGMPVRVEPDGRGVTIKAVAPEDRTHTVSRRSIAGGIRPVLDINSHRALGSLDGYEELKLVGSPGCIRALPSVRAFAIARARAAKPPFATLDLFAGGGTLSAAAAVNPVFNIVAGVEREPSYADCWQTEHPDALLVQADVRRVSPLELPRCEVLLAGIPCSDHCPDGRAKKKLAGDRAETAGEYGDLFVHVAAIVAAKMPLFALFENVPSFARSTAGLTLMANLRHLGYDVQDLVLEPASQWGEPSDRRRWVCFASLLPGFRLEIPYVAFQGPVSRLFDPVDAMQDRADAARIQGTIAALRAHNARHAALGHGWTMTVLDGTESKIPTIKRSYHKINSGPFVATPYGPRLLRQGEIERIMGCSVATTHYATACQVLGQGVQARVFAEILSQVGAFLSGERLPAATAAIAQVPVQPELNFEGVACRR